MAPGKWDHGKLASATMHVRLERLAVRPWKTLEAQGEDSQPAKVDSTGQWE